MMLLRRSLISFERAVASAWRGLDRPAVLAYALLLVPVLFGLLSLRYGQDDNWDLHNYHLYNPFALVHGKVGYDLAPGQWQSYFNPTIDLLYYGLNTVLPAPATGFVMGWLHGLNFVLLAAIARRLMPPQSHRAALLLALAGTLGPAFLSELGNTMGDNLIALTVLGALLLVLRAWPHLLQGGAPAWRAVALAGLLAGFGTGLKLTNAMYALALCLALFGVPAAFWLRFRLALLFGLGTLGGIGISAGHWYWRMWKTFGNPLFPQFNNIFKAPLAAPIGIGDIGWIPKGISEKLLWPFIFSYNSKRVIEIALTQLIWPLLYLAGVALVLRLLRDTIVGHRPADQLERPAGYALLFFGLSYLIWLNLFGIYRYLVPLELLAPLALWLVMQRLVPAAIGRHVAAWAVLLATVATFPGASWGHGSWTRTPSTAELPPLPEPEQNVIFTVHGDPPMSWLVPLFPDRLAFVALGGGFPESPAYGAKALEMMAARRGPFYVMMQAEGDNQKIWPAGQEVLGRYGITFDPVACVKYQAAVGGNQHPYQLCPVQPPATASK